LICGIIVSIELYLQVEKAMATEYDVSKSYYLLSIEIQRFLLTRRENRLVDCMPFLDKTYNQYIKLFENSRLLKKSIHDNLCDLEKEDKIIGITITPTQSVANQSFSTTFPFRIGARENDEDIYNNNFNSSSNI
jgi:hypothetical protein